VAFQLVRSSLRLRRSPIDACTTLKQSGVVGHVQNRGLDSLLRRSTVWPEGMSDLSNLGSTGLSPSSMDKVFIQPFPWMEEISEQTKDVLRFHVDLLDVKQVRRFFVSMRHILLGAAILHHPNREMLPWKSRLRRVAHSLVCFDLAHAAPSQISM
jgi:hypothetical protein